jgi:predicted ester cyclase
MRRYKTFALMAIICGGLTLICGEQKPTAQRQLPPQRPQVNPRTTEENKVPVRRLFEEMFSQGRYELTDQVFARGCPVHFGGRGVGLQEAVAEGKGWRSAAPDLVMTVEQISVNGDMVNVVWRANGTHTGQANGLKPTGKRISMQGRSQFKVENGKIVEAWNEEYRPELFRQLGVSRTQAFMFFTAERLLSALDPIIPERLYGSVQ